MTTLEDPQVTLEAPATGAAGETTSLLHPDTNKQNTFAARPWYWPWAPSYWAAVPVIFLTGMGNGPAFVFLAPMVKALFCERGIPAHLPGHHYEDSLPNDGDNDPQNRCDSAEYSAAIAQFTGISVALSSIIGKIEKAYGVVAVFWFIPAMFLLDVLYVSLMPETLSKKSMRRSRSAQLSNDTLVNVNNGLDDSDEDGHHQHRRVPHGASTTGAGVVVGKDGETLGYFDRLVKYLIPDQLPDRLGGKYSLLLLNITCFLALTAIMSVVFQVSNYTVYRFHWSFEEISYFSMIQGVARLFTLTLLLPFVKKFTPADPLKAILYDLKIMIVGIFIEACTMFLYGFTTIGEGFYLGAATGALGTLFFPAARGILSQSVSPELLGQGMGTMAMFESFSTILAPLAGSWIYAATIETTPSTLFYSSSFLTLVAGLLGVFIYFSHKRTMH
ncbi:hypothetical protein BG004_005919 [Podila humilis]|nr:hypothetical protein BG004_005919 [Podila humilis]